MSYLICWVNAPLGYRWLGKNGRQTYDIFHAVVIDSLAEAWKLANEANQWPISIKEKRYWEPKKQHLPRAAGSSRRARGSDKTTH